MLPTCDNSYFIYYIGCTGSLRYMAPEVALRNSYNEKVDVYSYGLIMYEIITGTTPYSSGFTKEEFYRRVVHGEEKPTFQIQPFINNMNINNIINSIYKNFQYFIIRCWDKNSLLRPSSTEVLEFIIQQEQLCQ